MKKPPIIIIISIFFILLITSCSEPETFFTEGIITDSNMGSIIINLGYGRTVYIPDQVIIDELEHDIQLTGPSGTINRSLNKGKLITEFSVVPGYWEILIKAWYGNYLYAESINSINVVSGQSSSVPVAMNELILDFLNLNLKVELVIGNDYGNQIIFNNGLPVSVNIDTLLGSGLVIHLNTDAIADIDISSIRWMYNGSVLNSFNGTKSFTMQGAAYNIPGNKIFTVEFGLTNAPVQLYSGKFSVFVTQ